MKILQRIHHRHGNLEVILLWNVFNKRNIHLGTYFAQHTFFHSQVVSKHLWVKFIQACIHYFHTNPNVPFSEKCTIKMHCVRTVARTHGYIQVHKQSFLFISIYCCCYAFHRHYRACLLMPHFFHNTISSTPQIGNFFQAVCIDFELLITYINCGTRVQISWRHTADKNIDILNRECCKWISNIHFRLGFLLNNEFESGSLSSSHF